MGEGATFSSPTVLASLSPLFIVLLQLSVHL